MEFSHRIPKISMKPTIIIGMDISHCSPGHRDSLSFQRCCTWFCYLVSIWAGIEYLYEGISKAVVHQNISAEKILLDQHLNPLLSDCGLHKLLADDIVYSILKSSAGVGYLALEYTTVGRLTEESDVYAFGITLL